jgi:hypothetical protein
MALPRLVSVAYVINFEEGHMLHEENVTKSAQPCRSAWNEHSLRVAAAALVVIALVPVEAQAYTDPGTGAFLVQTLLAAVAGGLFFMRTLRQRIGKLLKRNRE